MELEWVMWVVAFVSAGLAIILLKVANVIWIKPLHLKKYYEAQGIHGPPYKLLYGNVPHIVKMASQASCKPLAVADHNISPRVLPAYHEWRKTYGEDFVFWFGTKPKLYAAHPDLVKEILCKQLDNCDKEQPKQLGKRGIGRLIGKKWAQHRRILNPAFHIQSIQGMIPLIVESTINMMGEWTKLVSSGANEIDVFKEFSTLTADIIARTTFGSSYAEGKCIFHLQAQQTLLFNELLGSVYIPGSRFLPTTKNRQRWWLEKEVKRRIQQVIKSRESTASIKKCGDYGTDLFGLLMTSNKKHGEGKLENDMSMTIDEIVSECETLYIAGQETTASLLTWTLLLLAMHQEWQERGRREVLEVCGANDFPNENTVNGLKIVGMILNESLRLYPPAVAITRVAYKPMKLGRLSVPAGTKFEIPILSMQNDPALWGNDVHEFNPERFGQGNAKAAKHPFAFMPFGLGPRICIGQNFALLEAKIVLSMILQQFSFVISPHYIHAPIQSLLLKPQHGAQLILSVN